MRWFKKNSRGNSIVTYDGIVFRSKLEKERYQWLQVMQLNGLISQLRIHHRWPLHANSVLIGHYESDFDYLDASGKTVVEDTKGYREPLYKWKAKHFNAQYTPIAITEISGNQVRAA